MIRTLLIIGSTSRSCQVIASRLPIILHEYCAHSDKQCHHSEDEHQNRKVVRGEHRQNLVCMAEASLNGCRAALYAMEEEGGVVCVLEAAPVSGEEQQGRQYETQHGSCHRTCQGRRETSEWYHEMPPKYVYIHTHTHICILTCECRD